MRSVLLFYSRAVHTAKGKFGITEATKEVQWYRWSWMLNLRLLINIKNPLESLVDASVWSVLSATRSYGHLPEKVHLRSLGFTCKCIFQDPAEGKVNKDLPSCWECPKCYQGKGSASEVYKTGFHLSFSVFFCLLILTLFFLSYASFQQHLFYKWS